MTDRDRSGFRRVFRLPFAKKRIAGALDDELEFHLDGRIREFEARGMSRAQAELEAKRRFGDFDAYRRETQSIDETTLRHHTRMELWDTIRRETSHAAASLVRAPAFSSIVFITLALGLGAATTIFTLLDRVVLRPLPYPGAERLVHIGTLWPMVRADAEFAISRAQFFYFKENSATLANIGLYDTDVIPVPGDGGAHAAERVPAVLASASLFEVLGIRPELGRLFTADEGIPRRRSVALIGHGYWERRFGSDPQIVGKRLLLSGDQSYEIIGVLPAGANVPEVKADLWIPNWLDPAAEPQNNHTHWAIALAKPGLSLDVVRADLLGTEKRFEALWPNIYRKNFIESGFALNVQWLQTRIVGDKVTRALWILFGGVAVVLLIAGANVANLFLVRIEARRREVAVRAALGAGRGHLAAHFLTESILLSGAAWIGAVLASYALLHVVLVLAPQNLPRLEEITLDWRGMLFCLGLALVSGVVFGLLPLTSRTEDVTLLREGGRGLAGSSGRNAARRLLVVSQVALAVVLFGGAALMVKSYARLRDVRPGFDPAGVTAMQVALPYARFQSPERVSAFWHQLLDRVRTIPGVTRAGATDDIPLVGQSGCTAVITDGARNTEKRSGCVPTIVVAPGYFETMRIAVRGQEADWVGTDAAVGPVVLSKAFADEFFPGEDPVGHGIKINSNVFPFFRIVGVAEDVRGNGLQKPPVNAVYFPLVPPKGAPGWEAGYFMAMVVRAPGIDAGRLYQMIRPIVTEIDPHVPVDEPKAMELVVAASMAQTSFTMMLLLISAFIALLLSAVGLYGVISYIVSHRRSEIGIRMALGAREREVATMVLRQALGLALVGVLLGVAGAMATTRAMQSLLFGVSPTDPAVLVLTGVTLLLVAALASFLPARRAARVDPVEALRSG